MTALLPTLEMLLRQNNAAVVQEEGIYKILPISTVQGGSITPQLGGSTLPIPAGFSVLAVPLKYVGAREMFRLLEPFAPAESIRVDEVRNLLIIAGGQREMEHLIDTIDLFDVDWLAGYSVGLFPIRSTDVKSLTADLDKLFGATAQSPLAGIVRVIPIERMNGLLVVTTQPRYLEMAKTWIERIDQTGGTQGGTRLYVFQVRNGKAENLAQLIGDLFSSRRSTTTARRRHRARPAPHGNRSPARRTGLPTPSRRPRRPDPRGRRSGRARLLAVRRPGRARPPAEVRVIADKDTNTLLILASPGDYEIVENALRRLDVVRRQVLVEVMLAEVSLTDSLSFGLNYFLHTRNNTLGSLNTGQACHPAGRRANSGHRADRQHRARVHGPAAHQLRGGPDVRAVLNALGSDGKAKVLASPQIMVLDNQKAQIKVGDRISVQTQTQTGVTTGTGVLNSYQYLETGILLAVTPRINSGGMVTLDINQEVSQPTAPFISGNPNPDVATRNAKTSVQVASGETIALGGLIRENKTRSTNGIPLLSKIPVLGALFGFQEYKRDRTELVLLITPKIVSDTTQAGPGASPRSFRTSCPSLGGRMLPKAPAEDAPRPTPPGRPVNK